MSREGTIYRRKSDGRWVAKVSRGSREDRHVFERYLPRTAKRSEALALLEQLKQGLGLGVAPRALTLSAYLASWVADARDIRPRTRDGYANSIANHIGPLIGHVRLLELSPIDVERMLARLGQSRSPATVRHAHATLRRALTQAVRLGMISRNVAGRLFIDAPHVERGDPDALSYEEENAILDVLDGSGIEAEVLFALHTGLRQGEQLGLEWANLGSLVVRVEKELARVDGEYDRVDLKTKRSKRDVPLNEMVLGAIAIHREQLADRGFMTVKTGPVFPSQAGRPMSGSWLTHRWYKLLEAAGVRRRPWKILRATFASRLHDRGVPDRVIADLLGHARTHTTQENYISTAGVDARAAVGLLVDTHADTHGIVDSVRPSASEYGRTTEIEHKSGEPRRTRTFNQLIKSQLFSRSELAS